MLNVRKELLQKVPVELPWIVAAKTITTIGKNPAVLKIKVGVKKTNATKHPRKETTRTD